MIGVGSSPPSRTPARSGADLHPCARRTSTSLPSHARARASLASSPIAQLILFTRSLWVARRPGLSCALNSSPTFDGVVYRDGKMLPPWGQMGTEPGGVVVRGGAAGAASGHMLREAGLVRVNFRDWELKVKARKREAFGESPAASCPHSIAQNAIEWGTQRYVGHPPCAHRR